MSAKDLKVASQEVDRLAAAFLGDEDAKGTAARVARYMLPNGAFFTLVQGRTGLPEELSGPPSPSGDARDGLPPSPVALVDARAEDVASDAGRSPTATQEAEGAVDAVEELRRQLRLRRKERE